jgi:hypothetical protein
MAFRLVTGAINVPITNKNRNNQTVQQDNEKKKFLSTHKIRIEIAPFFVGA